MGNTESENYSNTGYINAKELDLIICINKVKSKIPLISFSSRAKISTLLVYDWLFVLLDKFTSLIKKSKITQQTYQEQFPQFFNSGTSIELLLDFEAVKVKSLYLLRLGSEVIIKDLQDYQNLLTDIGRSQNYLSLTFDDASYQSKIQIMICWCINNSTALQAYLKKNCSKTENKYY